MAANSSQRNLHSPLMRTPLSDILDRSTLSDITNVTSPDERRKLRKLILDNKKSKNASSSSTNVRNIFSDNANLLECSDTTDQHMYSIARRAVRNATGSLISTTPDNDINMGTPLDSNRRYSITSNIISSNNQPILGSISILTRLCSGKRNLEREKHDKTPVPMLNLDSDEDDVFFKRTKPSSPTDKELDFEMTEYLRALLDSQNMLVKTYRMVRDHYHQSPEANLSLRLIYIRKKDGMTYNLPTTSEVAALVVGDIDKTIDHRDIVVET
ncbi:uncharacterized protein LOC110870099 [Helianthus annuus]|uniref:uncharacterized protein LOC110870099 n=1 Tax=Helianthus annuus TaxID=4232 RepID=UPI000B8F87F6|nr:uncharacterized protein LOC110870099 [Helianthus annuus]